MTQLPLIVPTAQGEQPWPKTTLPLARTDDPATSKQAAAEMANSVRLGELQSAALCLVKENPGATANELSRVFAARLRRVGETEHDSRTIPRRLRELERLELIEARGTKKDPVTNKQCLCWWPK